MDTLGVLEADLTLLVGFESAFGFTVENDRFEV